MGEIDLLAKHGGTIQPNLWWRYRDDIVDVWTQGPDKLLEFTDYVNALYPTIKFELVYSSETLNVLDLTLSLKEGYISTDIYAKPTDSHLYLPFNSSHPAHCKRSVPYGVALRLNRNCSSPVTLNQRSREYKQYLKNQGYPTPLIEAKFSKALSIDRSNLLRASARAKKKVVPLVLDYNPRLPDVSKIIHQHVHLLNTSPELQDIFPTKTIIPAFRKTKNLKEFLAPSKGRHTKQLEPHPSGCFKCHKRCDLCANYFQEANYFQSYVTGRKYVIKENLSCESKNVIYLASCTKCRVQYVGSTSNSFKVRFRNHKSAMKTGKKNCEVAVHFNNSSHSLNDYSFICIEQIRDFDNVDQKLLSREAYWTAQLRTLQPFGLNKRREYKSKNRIQY